MNSLTLHRTSLLLLILFILSIMQPSTYALTPKEPLWSMPDPVADLAVSGDGGIVVISNYTHVKVFDGSGNLLWSFRLNPGIEVTAVDVSRDGNAVVAAFYDGSLSYLLFWRNAASLSGSPPPTWFFEGPHAFVDMNSLAISGNGNHVVAAFYNGTHSGLAYWNNTLALEDLVGPTWYTDLWDGQLKYVDISFNGLSVLVAALTSTPTPSAFLFYIGNVIPLSGLILLSSLFYVGIGVGPSVDVIDMALSDNGRYAVVSYYNSLEGYSVYYYDFTWAPSYRYWETEFGLKGVNGVDISSDGSIVVATVTSGYPVMYASYSHVKPDYRLMDDFYFGPSNISFYHVDPGFANGSMIWPDVNVSVDDWLGRVSVSGDGSLAVAGNVFTIFSNGSSVYAASDDGGLLWYNTSSTPISDHVRVSYDGRVAVTGGSDFDSLYYFQTGGPSIVGGEAHINVPNRISGVAVTAMMFIAIAAGVYLIARRHAINTTT